MKKTALIVLMGLFFAGVKASAQQKTVTGKITSEQGSPLPDASIVVKGTANRTTSDAEGNYSIRAESGQVLQFRAIGATPEEHVVGAADVLNVQLKRVARSLDAVVVTALGQTAAQRALGTAQQTIRGEDVAQAQRENFVNSLQGRVAGVDVTSSSGVPGASSSITIRGISSISSSNQPLMILDGLPMDNRTLSTGVLASDNNATSAFSNRSVDFTNRAADLNPEDIESLTVSETEHEKHVSRITIVTRGTPMVIEQIKNQLERLIPIHRVIDVTLTGQAIEHELAMIKVRGASWVPVAC